jgi:transcriptional regulator GlxA family with amidase domain
MAFDWVCSVGPGVDWVAEARWVEDGKIFTSSGVSAGMDMSLAVIARLHGVEVARKIAIAAEYEWQEEADRDPFARLHGLV